MRTVRFPTDHAARVTYEQVQDALYEAVESELSAYNLQFDGVPHVVVIGDQPPAALREQIETRLGTGTPSSLPEDVLRALNRRRLQQIKRGSWVEEHHRPGKRLEP